MFPQSGPLDCILCIYLRLGTGQNYCMFSFLKNILFLFYEYESFAYIYVCVPCACGIHISQQKALNSLDL